jgi:hypothetical protein
MQWTVQYKAVFFYCTIHCVVACIVRKDQLGPCSKPDLSNQPGTEKWMSMLLVKIAV